MSFGILAVRRWAPSQESKDGESEVPDYYCRYWYYCCCCYYYYYHYYYFFYYYYYYYSCYYYYYYCYYDYDDYYYYYYYCYALLLLLSEGQAEYLPCQLVKAKPNQAKSFGTRTCYTIVTGKPYLSGKPLSNRQTLTIGAVSNRKALSNGNLHLMGNGRS